MYQDYKEGKIEFTLQEYKGYLQMAFYTSIIRYLRVRCEDCGSSVQGVFIVHPTFGTVRACCARAASGN